MKFSATFLRILGALWTLTMIVLCLWVGGAIGLPLGWMVGGFLGNHIHGSGHDDGGSGMAVGVVIGGGIVVLCALAGGVGGFRAGRGLTRALISSSWCTAAESEKVE